MDEDGEEVPDGWPEGFGPGPRVGMRPGYSVIEATGWYTYVSNNPALYVNPTGMWVGVDGVFTGPVDEIIVIVGLAFLTWIGVEPAQEAIDSLSDVLENIVDSIFKSKDDTDGKQEKKKPSRNPLRGEPGSENTTEGKKGEPKQTRKYGENGYPDYDIDHVHNHGQVRHHKHYWTRPEDGSAPTLKNRQPRVPFDDT